MLASVLHRLKLKHHCMGSVFHIKEMFVLKACLADVPCLCPGVFRVQFLSENLI